MKKIVAIALALALTPSVVAADQIFNIPFGQSFTNGIYLPTVSSGQCLTTTGAMSQVVGTGSACGGVASVTAGTNVTITGTSANPIINASGGGGGASFFPIMFVGVTFLPTPLANLSYGNQNNSYQIQEGIPAGMIIGHLNVACAAYNPTDAAASQNEYSPLDANGLGGATIGVAIVNGSHSVLSPNVIGSVVIPTSPQGGPWVTTVTSAVGTPYTIQAGDSIVADVTATSTSATQWASQCNLNVGS